VAACRKTPLTSVRPYKPHEKFPSMAARVLPTLTEIAVIEKDQGLLARNQFRYMFILWPYAFRYLNKFGESASS
jgi:hypothetical protein